MDYFVKISNVFHALKLFSQKAPTKAFDSSKLASEWGVSKVIIKKKEEVSLPLNLKFKQS